MRPEFLQSIDDPPAPVTCGACPVSMWCAAEKGGTGWTYDCCGSTSFDQTIGEPWRSILVIDCGRQRLGQAPAAKDCRSCPLCSGDIVAFAVELEDDPSTTYEYLPTVHARVPLADRLSLWRPLLARYRAGEGP